MQVGHEQPDAHGSRADDYAHDGGLARVHGLHDRRLRSVTPTRTSCLYGTDRPVFLVGPVRMTGAVLRFGSDLWRLISTPQDKPTSGPAHAKRHLCARKRPLRRLTGRGEVSWSVLGALEDLPDVGA
jgi:hypothetical protein